MPALIVQRQPHCTFTHFGGKLVCCLAHEIVARAMNNGRRRSSMQTSGMGQLTHSQNAGTKHISSRSVRAALPARQIMADSVHHINVRDGPDKFRACVQLSLHPLCATPWQAQSRSHWRTRPVERYCLRLHRYWVSHELPPPHRPPPVWARHSSASFP